jgi:hypothetical protein
VLGEYNLSIWVDGNVIIKGDLNKLLKNILKDDCSIYVPTHPQRKCIYAESEAVIAMKKDTREIIKPQLDRYRSEGFPKDFGLLQSNIMIRKHNEKDCIKFIEEWFSEVKNGSQEMLVGGEQILKEMRNLSEVTRVISENMNQINEFSQQISDAVTVTTASTNSTQENLQALMKDLNSFKLN